MTEPFHKVNILTGTKAALIIEEGAKYADLIKKAKRPLLVLGARVLEDGLLHKPLMEYAVELARAANMPICATAHTKKRLLEQGIIPECSYDLVEIINSLKNPNWSGVKGEGNHDLVIFFGIRTDLAQQVLSTLKHYAPHLKTATLCKYYYPHASYSLPNFLQDKKWQALLDAIIKDLKEV